MTTDSERLRRHSRYQREYFQRSHRTLARPDSPYLRRHVERMLLRTGLQPGNHVLEVGCGTGRYTLIMAEMGIRIEGLDLTPELLDTLRAETAGRLEIPLHACDLIDCPTEMFGRYDAVIGYFVLHHLHDLDASFAAIARLVRPGGCVAFLEPNPLNPLYYVQITLTPEMSWKGERGIFQMRPKVIAAAMNRVGIEDVFVHRFGFFPPMVTNRRRGIALESAFERFPLWRPALPFQLFGGRTRDDLPRDLMTTHLPRPTAATANPIRVAAEIAAPTTKDVGR
jgi:2-polyprenyl-3-methyl-5-hydroxy-6-metoxy-1,4-benzoquinol methylase